MTIEKFYLLDADGNESDSVEYDRFDTARDEAVRLAATDLGLTRRRVTFQGGQRLEYI